MNTRLVLPAICLATILLAPAHATKKNKEQQTPAVAPAVGSSGLPSDRLDPFLEPCLDAVLSPLDGDPKMPRVEVEKLRASFAAGQIKAKTQAQQQIFQNAMAVCDALTRSMDDRASAQAAAQASSTVPMRSEATGIIKSSPRRGFDAGANAEAIRKKQKDERKDADGVALRNVAYMNSTAGRLWTERAPVLRRGVMALFTRQVQLEALEERNAAIAVQAAGAAQAAEAAKAAKAAQEEAAVRIAAAAQATKAAADEKVAKVRTEALARAAAAEKAAKTAQADAAAKAAAAEKAESAKLARAKSLATEAAYVGEWALRAGHKSMTVNEDHTAIRTLGSGEQTNGAWNIVDGLFRLHWEEGTGIKGQLSADGQVIEGGKGLQWFRKKSQAGSNTAAETGAQPAKPPAPPAEKPAPEPAAKTAKNEPANESPYVGMWNGAGDFEIKGDHTATRTRGKGEKTDGTWTIDEDGDFHVKWADNGKFKAKLSSDGQTLTTTVGKGGASWTRRKP